VNEGAEVHVLNRQGNTVSGSPDLSAELIFHLTNDLRLNIVNLLV